MIDLIDDERNARAARAADSRATSRGTITDPVGLCGVLTITATVSLSTACSTGVVKTSMFFFEKKNQKTFEY